MSKKADYSKYDQLLEQARGSAKYWIPKLCQALREESSEMSNEDIRERVTKDCLPIWQRGTINNALPEEYKNKERSETGKKGRKKQLEQADGTVTITQEPTESWAKDDSNPPTEQKSQTFDRPGLEKVVSQLQSQLNDTKQELEEAKKIIDTLQEQQNVKDILQLVDDKIGPVNIANLSKINEYNRRGHQVLAGRFGELVRRRLVDKDKDTIKFYILDKDRTTNIESLVPVSFTVDMLNGSTEMVLDEDRL